VNSSAHYDFDDVACGALRVGAIVGAIVGEIVRVIVGATVGLIVGAIVRAIVGCGVARTRTDFRGAGGGVVAAVGAVWVELFAPARARAMPV
jgi:hypothetical protein